MMFWHYSILSLCLGQALALQFSFFPPSPKQPDTNTENHEAERIGDPAFMRIA
jgi:hypothetical protein